MNRKRLAILGNGMAAGRFLDELVRRNAHALFEISVYGEERHSCYNRSCCRWSVPAEGR